MCKKSGAASDEHFRSTLVDVYAGSGGRGARRVQAVASASRGWLNDEPFDDKNQTGMERLAPTADDRISRMKDRSETATATCSPWGRVHPSRRGHQDGRGNDSRALPGLEMDEAMTASALRRVPTPTYTLALCGAASTFLDAGLEMEAVRNSSRRRPPRPQTRQAPLRPAEGTPRRPRKAHHAHRTGAQPPTAAGLANPPLLVGYAVPGDLHVNLLT